MKNRIRVLLAKPGLDCHDLGVKVICAAMRDAGMEVIYGGLGLKPEDIAVMAEQEDVDVIGLSMHSSAHLELCAELQKELQARDLTDILVVAGGIIPRSDYEELHRLGVLRVFGPGSNPGDMVKFIQEQNSVQG